MNRGTKRESAGTPDVTWRTMSMVEMLGIHEPHQRELTMIGTIRPPVPAVVAHRSSDDDRRSSRRGRFEGLE
jgi:hypothetical protein